MEIELGCNFCQKPLTTSRLDQPNQTLRRWVADLICKRCHRIIVVEVKIAIISDKAERR